MSGDAGRLQVPESLSNAIKYSAGGRVEVRLTRDRNAEIIVVTTAGIRRVPALSVRPLQSGRQRNDPAARWPRARTINRAASDHVARWHNPPTVWDRVGATFSRTPRSAAGGGRRALSLADR